MTWESLPFITDQLTTSIKKNVEKVRFFPKSLFSKLLIAFIIPRYSNVILKGGYKEPRGFLLKQETGNSFGTYCGSSGLTLEYFKAKVLIMPLLPSPLSMYYYKRKPLSALSIAYICIDVRPSAIT